MEIPTTWQIHAYGFGQEFMTKAQSNIGGLRKGMRAPILYHLHLRSKPTANQCNGWLAGQSCGAAGPTTNERITRL